MSNDYYSFPTMREIYDDSSDYFRDRKLCCLRHYLHYVVSVSFTVLKQMSNIKIEHVDFNEILCHFCPRCATPHALFHAFSFRGISTLKDKSRIEYDLVTQFVVTTILASHFTALVAADALHFLSFSLVFYPVRVCWWWQITDTYHKIVLPAMYLTSIAPKWLYVANWEEEEEGLELCQVTRRRLLSRILQ